MNKNEVYMIGGILAGLLLIGGSAAFAKRYFEGEGDKPDGVGDNPMGPETLDALMEDCLENKRNRVTIVINGMNYDTSTHRVFQAFAIPIDGAYWRIYKTGPDTEKYSTPYTLNENDVLLKPGEDLEKYLDDYRKNPEKMNSLDGGTRHRRRRPKSNKRRHRRSTSRS